MTFISCRFIVGTCPAVSRTALPYHRRRLCRSVRRCPGRPPPATGGAGTRDRRAVVGKMRTGIGVATVHERCIVAAGRRLKSAGSVSLPPATFARDRLELPVLSSPTYPPAAAARTADVASAA